MLTLRDYQKASAAAICKLLREQADALSAAPYSVQRIRARRRGASVAPSVVAVSPTGSGKTVIGLAVAHGLKPKRVAWVAHRYELLTQVARHLRDGGCAESEIGWATGRKAAPGDRTFTLVSVDMPRAKLRAALQGVDLIVIDEAHRALAPTYQVLRSFAPEARVLGLTATPWRLDGKGLKDAFQALYVCATQTDLIAAKYIAQPITYGLTRAEARELTRGVPAGGDFAQGKLGKALSSKMLVGRVVGEWQRLAKGRSTLVFAATRAHARRLVTAFAAVGERFA